MGRRIRLHVNEEWLGRLPFETILAEADAHHLFHVLRLSKGDPLEIYDAKGHRFGAEILSPEDRRVRIVAAIQDDAMDAQWCFIVFQATPKGQRMDEIVRPLAELGVDLLRPVLCERSVVRFDSKEPDQWEKKLQRWNRIAKESANQSGRKVPMKVAEPISYMEALGEGGEGCVRILLDPNRRYLRSADELIRHASENGAGNARKIVLLVGPEGGFSEGEKERALKAGFWPLCIQSHTLRSETAALAAMAILRFVLE